MFFVSIYIYICESLALTQQQHDNLGTNARSTESGQKKTKGAPCVATKLSECVMTNGVCDGVESGCRAQFVADGTPCNNNAGLCDDGICITGISDRSTRDF